MKTMSIIGIIGFSICLACMIIFYALIGDKEAPVGYGMLGMLYAISFAIVGVFKSNIMVDLNFKTNHLILSYIGISLFGISVAGMMASKREVGFVWGIIGLSYALVYAIVVFQKLRQLKKHK